MFNSKNHDRSPSWYPGKQAIRDRFGADVGPNFGGREYGPRTENPDTVLTHMRWGLGLM